MEFQPPRVRVGKWPTGKSGLTIYSCASCALNNPKGSHSHVTIIGFTVIDLQLWQISDKWQNSILRKWSNFLTCTKSPISARSGTASKTQEGVRRESEKEWQGGHVKHESWTIGEWTEHSSSWYDSLQTPLCQEETHFCIRGYSCPYNLATGGK